MRYEIIVEDKFGDTMSFKYDSLKEAIKIFNNSKKDFALIKLIDINKVKVLKTYYNHNIKLVHLSHIELLIVKVLKTGPKFKNEIRALLKGKLTEKELTETLNSLSRKNLIFFKPSYGWVWSGDFNYKNYTMHPHHGGN